MAKLNGKDVFFAPFIHPSSIDQEYDPESTNPQSGTAVKQALGDVDLTELEQKKLNKIHIEDINSKSDITKDAFDVFGTHPCFYANIYDDNNGNPYQHDNILVRGSSSRPDPLSVAVRDSNGSVVVQVADIDPSTGKPWVGSAVPHSFVNNIKNHLINDFIKPKSITSRYITETGLEQGLSASAMYIVMHNTGENDIRLSAYKNNVTANALDAQGNEIPPFQAGLIIVPQGVTKDDGGTDWYAKRGILIAITGESLVGIPEFAIKQFYFWQNDCPPNFADKNAPTGKDPNGVSFNAGSMFINNLSADNGLSVWQIKL